MKHFFTAMLCMITISVLFAQKKEWKQMEDFHTIMSKSYHPVEKGNLQPVKDNIDSLILSAKAWQSSPVPTGYNIKEVKPKLDKLVADCLAVKEAVVQKKNNDTVKKLITAAHSTFHEIMEKGEE